MMFRPSSKAMSLQGQPSKARVLSSWDFWARLGPNITTYTNTVVTTKMKVWQVDNVLKAFNGFPVTDFLTLLLENPTFNSLMVWKQFLNDPSALLNINHPNTRSHTRNITFHFFTTILKTEVTTMASKTSGWHFSAKNVSFKQIDAFSINGMADSFTKQTPYLWAILGVLLASDSQVK